MTYLHLTYLHLATIAPAFLLGTYLLINQKGTNKHRQHGKIYMGLMLITAFITLFMSAKVGPTLFNHFGAIHLLSVLVFYTVPAAYLAAKNGEVVKHKSNMLGLYIGGLLIAGTFTLMPGRLLHYWIFG